jgi:hypothetical protein
MSARSLLVLLVAAATASFVVGTAIERNSGETHTASSEVSEGHEELNPFAVLDVREVVHQVDEHRGGLAALAAAVALAHGAAAAVATWMARPLSG